jgi:hypothetical protein
VEVLISLLITLVILAIFFWIVQWMIGLLGLPEPIGKIVQVLFVLICLIVILRVIGVWGGGPYYYFGHGAVVR